MESDWTIVEKKQRVIKPSESSSNSSPKSVYTPPFKTQSNFKDYNNSDFKYKGNNNRGGGFKNGANNTGYHKKGGSFQKDRRTYEPFVMFASPEEETKFTKLQLEIPHIMMPGHIRNIQRKINIDDLAEKMLTDEWIAYQREGWVYERVIKPDETGGIPDGDNYDIRELGNKWGDIILFKKVDA